MPISTWSRDYDLKNLDKAVDDLKQYISELEKKANEVTGKLMPVKQVGALFGKRYTSLDSYAPKSGWCATPHFSKIVEKARAHCEEIWKEVCETHEENKAALENNTALYDQIVLFMHNVGIPTETSEYPITRSGRRAKEPVRKSAGYITDLNKHVIRNDGFTHAQQEYETFKRQINEYEKKKLQEEAVAKRAKDLEEKKQQAEKIRATLVLKYGLPYESDFREILEQIISQNKYLRLAHFLQRTALDWHDGPDQAEYGLEGFVPDNPLETEIYRSLRHYIDEWDGDGRVFRDCEYGYHYLFDVAGKENPGLVEDYGICINAIGDD